MAVITQPQGLESTTLALHFLQPARPRDIEEAAVVAVRLVELIIRAVQPKLMHTGSLIVRAAQLANNWDYSPEHATKWYESVHKSETFDNGSLVRQHGSFWDMPGAWKRSLSQCEAVRLLCSGSRRPTDRRQRRVSGA